MYAMNDQTLPIRPSETTSEAPSNRETPQQEQLEGLELATEVREIVGERSNEKAPQPAGAKQSGDQTAAAPKTTLPLAQRIEFLEREAPEMPVMKKLVERAIERQIAELRTEMKQALKQKGGPNYYLLQNIYLKICDLKEILASLAHAAAEMVKQLWFRFVHGIVL